MYNRFNKREEGPLFDERVQIDLQPRQEGRVVARRLGFARLFGQNGKPICRGILKYKRGNDRGRRTRVLIFRAFTLFNQKIPEILVGEQTLNGSRQQ